MTTEERIEKLEAELTETKAGLAVAKRLISRLMVGAGVVLGMFALFVAVRAITGVAYSQAGGNIAEVIRAKNFEMVDNQGKTRATLKVNVGGVLLGLLDEKGRHRVVLRVTENGEAGLELADEKGTLRGMLTSAKGGSGLSFADEKGYVRSYLGVSQTKTPDGKTSTYPVSTLSFGGPDGKVIFEIAR